MSDKPSLAIVGAGRVGQTLGVLLARAGYRVVAVHSRTRESAETLAGRVGAEVVGSPEAAAKAADLVLLTVPDDVIEPVCAEIARRGGWGPGKAVVHTSGAHSLDSLESAREAGAHVGSLHPLQAFATVEAAMETLPGSTFGLEADGEPLRGWLTGIVKALDGRPLWLKPGDKAVYHAAAVIASNYVVALFACAAGLLEALGMDRDGASAALMPLTRGAVANLEKIGLPGALTGPLLRGDVGTIKRHLTALDAMAPEVASLYRLLARHTLPLAVERGLSTEKVAEIGRIVG